MVCDQRINNRPVFIFRKGNYGTQMLYCQVHVLIQASKKAAHCGRKNHDFVQQQHRKAVEQPFQAQATWCVVWVTNGRVWRSLGAASKRPDVRVPVKSWVCEWIKMQCDLVLADIELPLMLEATRYYFGFGSRSKFGGLESEMCCTAFQNPCRS